MFQFIPNEMFQQRLLWFQRQPFARTSPACHDTLRHKDARHSHANRIFTLPDKMRLFSAIEIIPGERSCCVSAVLKSILHFCTSKKKKQREKSRYNKKGSQLPVFTYRAEGLLIIHIIHFSSPERVFFFFLLCEEK